MSFKCPSTNESYLEHLTLTFLITWLQVLCFIGLNGKSPNLYMYALNNPLIVKDPTGRIPLPIITSLISVGVHLITTPPSQVTFGSKLMFCMRCYYRFNATRCNEPTFGRFSTFQTFIVLNFLSRRRYNLFVAHRCSFLCSYALLL